MKVLLAGGGSAGHTSPLLATADALRRLDASVEVTALGTPRAGFMAFLCPIKPCCKYEYITMSDDSEALMSQVLGQT